MRILFLNHNVIWRSTFFRCYHFGRYLVKKGHQVTIYTIHPTNRTGIQTSELQGVRVVQFPDWLWGMGRSGWDPWDVACRLRYLRNEPYDLVHAFDSRPVVIHPALALKKRGIPLVMDWADWWGRGGVIEERSNPLIRYAIGGIETWYEEHFRTQADATTVISSALRERAIGLGVPGETIVKITGGADVENFQPQDKAVCRKKMGIALDAPVLGFMGFVHYDLDLAIKTFARLYRQNPATKLVLAGKPSAMARRLSGQEGCAAGLVECGVLPYGQIPEVMGAADIFLLPFAHKQSNIGRWPNKVGDYMAMGRPVLSSPVGEMEVLFKNEAIGRLAEPTPEAYAQAATEMLADPAYLAQTGATARQAALQRLSWEHLTQELEAVYTRVLASPQSGRG